MHHERDLDVTQNAELHSFLDQALSPFTKSDVSNLSIGYLAPRLELPFAHLNVEFNYYKVRIFLNIWCSYY